MAIITLTTDLGLKDHFVGVLKGKILSTYPEAAIVDISHHIDPFNIVEGHYVLQAAYPHFPKGTVHYIGIDIERSRENKHVAVLLDGHFFVGPDNGIISMLAQKMIPEQMVEISFNDNVFSSQTDIDSLVTAAVHLAKGGVLNLVGRPLKALKDVLFMKAQYLEAQKILRATVIYIDEYGNAVTNVTKADFENACKGRPFEIVLKHVVLKKILNKYSEILSDENQSLKSFEGRELAIFNEAGFLEIAIFRSNQKTVGSAQSLLGLDIKDIINIRFK
jgi:S-adenosylmethionine hydrolase